MRSRALASPRAAFLAVAAACLTLGSWSLAAQDAPFAPHELTKNANFETDADSDSWPDHWGKAKAGGTWETEEGNHFIRLAASAPDQMTMLYQELAIPEGAGALEIKFRQRVSGLKKGKSAWFDARMMIEFRDAEGKKLSSPNLGATGRDTEGWVDRVGQYVVPEGAVKLALMPCLFKVETGTFDLDDLSVATTDPAPVREAADAKAAERAEKLARDAENKRSKAAALLAETGNLLANGNFELDVKKEDGWPDNWGKPKSGGSWELEGSNHFVRMTSTTPGELISMHRVADIPEGVKALELSWRQRVTGLKKGEMPWFDARIMLELKDAAGQKLPNKPSPPYTAKDTEGWVEKKKAFLVPEGALSVELMPALFQVKAGTFDLDDISLVPTDPAPLLAAAAEAERAAKARYVPPEEPMKDKWPLELHVEGNRLYDSAGKMVWLQGVNAGGMETLPADTQPVKSAVVAVDEWKANAVRLPVKEHFWFGRDPMVKDGGQEYRDRVDQIITLVANRGAYLILDLHRFRAPKPEHAEFWKDAAERYKNHPAVLFDIFNEPHDTSWEVWRNGGFVGEKTGTDESAFLTAEEKAKNKGFESIGMQGLVEAVRGTGAKNIIVAAGLFWSNDLTGITNGYALDDMGGHGIMYSWHVYNWHTDWKGKLAGVPDKYPILVGEVGADVKKMDFIPQEAQEDPATWVPDMLGYIQKHQLNWTGWCLHPRATPVMISDWNYTPTPYWGAPAKEALSGKSFELKKER